MILTIKGQKYQQQINHYIYNNNPQSTTILLRRQSPSKFLAEEPLLTIQCKKQNCLSRSNL